jgi:hypothetical protein
MMTARRTLTTRKILISEHSPHVVLLAIASDLLAGTQ